MVKINQFYSKRDWKSIEFEINNTILILKSKSLYNLDGLESERSMIQFQNPNPLSLNWSDPNLWKSSFQTLNVKVQACIFANCRHWHWWHVCDCTMLVQFTRGWDHWKTSSWEDWSYSSTCRSGDYCDVTHRCFRFWSWSCDGKQHNWHFINIYNFLEFCYFLQLSHQKL